MSLLYASGAMELVPTVPVRLEDLETQLDALQRLLSFASQRSTARLELQIETADGARVHVFGRTAVRPTGGGGVDYRDFPIRLGLANTQDVIQRWWAMMDNLRPIPQILTSILARQGYLETDFLLYATAVDRLSDAWTNEPGPLTPEQFVSLKEAVQSLGLRDSVYLDNEPAFANRALALARTLPDEVWALVRIDQESWLASLKRHRNLVAHSSQQRAAHREFLTGPGLRALRDATAAILTLIIVQHLGVTDTALSFAAKRQNNRRVAKHTLQILGFANDGIRASPAP